MHVKLSSSQAIDMEQVLLGNAPLLKVQVTYCSDDQTLLGITVARVLTGMHACKMQIQLQISQVINQAATVDTKLDVCLPCCNHFTKPVSCCNDKNGSNADLTGLVGMLKDWTTFHQSLSGQPKPVFDRQTVQPVSLTLLMLCSHDQLMPTIVEQAT